MTIKSHDPMADVRDATRALIVACACPHIHIMLLDENGKPFARAILTPEEFAEAAKATASYVALVRTTQGDTIGDVVGSA